MSVRNNLTVEDASRCSDSDHDEDLDDQEDAEDTDEEEQEAGKATVSRKATGAGFDLEDGDAAIRKELEELQSSDGSSNESATGGEGGAVASGGKWKRRSHRKKIKSAWSSVGSKANSIATGGSRLSGVVRSVAGSNNPERDERYLKEFAVLSKKRSPLNKKYKFKGKHVVYHGLDPNDGPTEEVEFESDWAPILIRASGRRMNPKKVQNLLPLLKKRIGQLVVNDPGMKRVIRPVYLKCTEQPKHVASGFTVCFNYPGLSLTHAEVRAAIATRLRDAVQMPYTIGSIQFLALASQLELSGMDNRWVVSVSRNDAKLELIRFGLKLRTSHVTVRDYGDVQRIEIAVWSLINRDRCESAASREALQTTPSGDWSSMPSSRSPMSAGGSAAGGRDESALGSVIGSDLDRVKHALLRRRNTYAELRQVLAEK